MQEQIQNFEVQRYFQIAAECEGDKFFSPECRELVYLTLENRNNYEWDIAGALWWDGVPWWCILGIFKVVLTPLKIILLATVPELRPTRDIDYTDYNWNDHFWQKFWYLSLASDAWMFLPYGFFVSQVMTNGTSDFEDLDISRMNIDDALRYYVFMWMLSPFIFIWSVAQFVLTFWIYLIDIVVKVVNGKLTAGPSIF